MALKNSDKKILDNVTESSCFPLGAKNDVQFNGGLTVITIWDLSLRQLAALAKDESKDLKEVLKAESFLENQQFDVDHALRLKTKLEILKVVIASKESEIKRDKRDSEKADKRKVLTNRLTEIDGESIKAITSRDEILKMIQNLDDED